MPYGACGRTAREVNRAPRQPPNGLELSRSAEAGARPHSSPRWRPGQASRRTSWQSSQLDTLIAHTGGHRAPTYPHARRVSFSELLGVRTWKAHLTWGLIRVVANALARQEERRR